MTNELLRLEHIRINFFGVTVLDDISLSIEKGKVYTLLGENGAGKSTLSKIIAGEYAPSGGEIIIGEKHYQKLTIHEAKLNGIQMVQQELQVVPALSVAENIFIGSELRRGCFVKKEEQIAQAQKLLDQFGMNVSATTPLYSIDIAGRQLVEIARSINTDADLIILDEPTSSLSEKEVAKLFKVVNELKKEGISFIFISHRLNEIFEISDKIVILKDGKLVDVLDPTKSTEQEAVSKMVGRTYSDYYMRERIYLGKEAFRVEHLSGIMHEGSLRTSFTPQDVSFQVEEGEILGIAGLVGAGRTEVLRLIFGQDPKGDDKGRIYVDGKCVDIHNVKDAMKHRMAWVTEDRKNEGIILPFTILSNLVLPIEERLKKGLFVDKTAEHDVAERIVAEMNVKCNGTGDQMRYLSGGNQQKVVVGKWLETKPKILFMDEPTRGIDVGAKAELYKTMNRLTSEGMAIVIISSELPEVIGMSDRIITMYEGKVTGMFERSEFSEEAIMKCVTGGYKDDNQ